jgi:hypothetical protein
MGKTSRKPAASSSTPATVASILGKINDSTIKPTKSQLAALNKLLSAERQSPSHQAALAAAQAALAAGERFAATDPNKDNSLPVTYETPGMIISGPVSKLLVGPRPFNIGNTMLPPKETYVMNDKAMSGGDTRVNWVGGEMLTFVIGASFFVLIGECTVIDTDIFDIAIMNRSGTGIYDWPDYRGALSCPICAKLASPGERKIAVSQLCMQKQGHRQGARMLMRLCCRDCFVANLRIPAGRPELAYPGCLRYSAPRYFPFDGSVPGAMNPIQLPPPDDYLLRPVLGAYNLNMMFEGSGMLSVATGKMMETISASLGGRESSSMTKDNRGQPVIKILGGDASCEKCGKTKEELQEEGGKLSNCGRCKLVSLLAAAAAAAANSRRFALERILSPYLSLYHRHTLANPTFVFRSSTAQGSARLRTGLLTRPRGALR